MLLLERENAHLRDARITFNEADHFYTVDSRRVVGSVSSLWASCFSRFDAPNTARRMVNRWSSRAAPGAAPDDAQWRWRYAYVWETLVNKTPPDRAVERLDKSGCPSFDFQEDDKGYCRLFWHLRKRGVTSFEAQTDALLSLWTALGERASGRGTYVHRQAELHCNSEAFEETVEMKQYLRFREDHPHLKPYRTEWSVFSYAHGGSHIVAGQIDGLYLDERSGEYEMIDYKVTAHELSPDNPYEKFGTYPFNTLPDTPWGHYCAQQQIYKYILEKEYGVRVKSCRLLRLHSSIDEYQLVDVLEQQSAVAALFDRCADSARMNVTLTPRQRWRLLFLRWFIVKHVSASLSDKK